MHLPFLAIAALPFSVNGITFLHNVGNTSIHSEETDLIQVRVPNISEGTTSHIFDDAVLIDTAEYTNPLYIIGEQHDSVNRPALLTQALDTNGVDQMNLVFECRSDTGRMLYYERNQVEQIITSFPRGQHFFIRYDTQQDKTYLAYPHHFKNHDELHWPLSRTTCDSKGQSRFEMPMGRGPTFRWDWEAYLNYHWPLPSMSRVGYNLTKPDPGLVRIVYVYVAEGNNLLCGVVIHTKDNPTGENKFRLCPLKEDPRNTN